MIRYAVLALLISLGVVLVGAILLVVGVDEGGPYSVKAIAGLVILVIGSVAGAAFNMRILFPKQRQKNQHDGGADER